MLKFRIRNGIYIQLHLFILIKNLLFALILVTSFSIAAQEPVVVNLTDNDGLPDIEFYDVIEDSNGFIWLAADSGLYRYDGKSYQHFTNSKKRGLSVFNVFEDYLGRIWCNNISGQFFYVNGDKLIMFIDLKDELKGQLSNFKVSKNHLIISKVSSLFTVNLKTRQVLKHSLTNTNNLSNVVTRNKEHFLLSTDSIWVFNAKFTQKQSYPLTYNNTLFKNLKTELRPFFFNFKEKRICHQKFNGKNKFFEIKNEKKFTADLLQGFELIENLRVNNVVEVEGLLWFLTNKGAYVYSCDKGVFVLKKHLLKKLTVTKVIRDKDFNYWISSLDKGIHIIPNIEIVKYSLPDAFSNITTMDKLSNSSLIIGTSNGHIGNFSLLTNQLETSVFLKSKVSALLCHDKKKNIYVATDYNSFLVNKNSFKISESGFFNGAKSVSAINKDTTLYCRFNNASFYIESIKKNVLLKEKKRAYTVHYNPLNQTSYVGYVDGLVSFNSNFEPKTIKYNGTEILANSIVQTTDGIVWVSTFKNGIYVLKDSSVINHYGTSKGLLSNQIEYLQSDGNQLWVATSKGVQYFNRKLKTFKSLTKTDGVPSYKISGIEIVDNEVFLASNIGVFSFNKDRVFKLAAPPKIYFESVEVNEKPVDFSKSLSLDYHQNAIAFSFNVNGLTFNQKGRYRYRLLGYDNRWVTTRVGETRVKYNSLQAGNYTFQVQPVFDAASKNNQVLDLKFSINKPYWETWWLRLLILSVVMGVTVLFFRRKIRKRELLKAQEIKQLSVENELIALKLENLRSQMNPHFIFNALNSIQEYIVLNQKNLASDYLGKFADLIRVYLDKSTKGKITLQEEINCLEMYLELEKLRFEDKLHYSIVTEGHINLDYVYIPTMLIQPYVENALKHGLLHRKSHRVLKIDFCINTSSKTVECIIKDNGIGREKAKAYKARSKKNHKPFATKATEDRLALLNYGKEKQIGVTITDLVKNKEAIGTQVNIVIPYTTY